MPDIIPIIIQPNLYVNGCLLSWTSNTTLTVGAGQARDSSNIYDITLNAPIVINGAANGANGLDSGLLANNTWYAAFVIFDPTNAVPPATLLSTSATAPVMPSVNGVTYSKWRRVGWVLTNGSAQFLLFYMVDQNSSCRHVQWDTPISILSGGSSATFAAVNVSAGAPKVANPVYLNITYTPASAANTANIRPTGSTTTAGNCDIVLKGAAAAAYRENKVKFLPLISGGNASLDYVVTSSDALSLTVAAFDDYL